jgi:hypothetical protein
MYSQGRRRCRNGRCPSDSVEESRGRDDGISSTRVGFRPPFSKEWPLALDVAQSWQLHPHSVRMCGKSDEKQATI